MSFSPWIPGNAPIAVILITLNEAHNMEAVLDNLNGFAQEVFVVDSYSRDQTVELALCYGVNVVQRRFHNFGDQWNFALKHLPINATWTMKLDPDERLTEALKADLLELTKDERVVGISVRRRLWFMGRPLPVTQTLTRVWRTGTCRFSDVSVNEYPIVDGRVLLARGELEHHDSPDLDHWLEKQNRYTTAEAVVAYRGLRLADEPNLLGTALQRRMWLKCNFHRLPLRFSLFFLYNYLWLGAWRAGWVGYVWARLRSDVMRLIEYKRREMQLTGRMPEKRTYGAGYPNLRVHQANDQPSVRTE